MIFNTSNFAAAVVTVSYLTLLFLTLVCTSDGATLDDWRGRSIYQLFTDRFAHTDGSTNIPCDASKSMYCGGTFQGIIKKLDYIQGMGFTAIWISPVIKNINDTGPYGQAYHGFWSKDITQINDHFGTEDDLKALSQALHDRGMYLMIDVVTNNMAYAGAGSDVDFSSFTPFNKKEYFHDLCLVSNFSDPQNVQECWLALGPVSLPDMNTENSFVQQTWNKWGQDIISNYKIDGFRIDAAKHVASPFWTSFQNAVNIFTMGEVFDGNPSTVCDYTHSLTSVLNFPLWYSLNATFTDTSHSMMWLENDLEKMGSYCQDPTTLGTFSENHDVARIASRTQDVSLLKNTLAFTIMTDGIPVVYYGAEQGFSGDRDPVNREALWPSGYNTSSPLYTLIAAANTARNLLSQNATYNYWSPYWTYKTKVVSAQDEMLALRKGYERSILTIVTNRGSSSAQMGPYSIGDTNFNEGDIIVELLTCASMTVGPYGLISVTIPAGGNPMIWVPAKYLHSTQYCSDIVSKAPSASTISHSVTSGSSAIASANYFYAMSILILAAMITL